MSTATKTTKAAPAAPAAPARRPPPAKCCSRCGAAIIGPVIVLEISRIAHRGPDCSKWLLCAGCCDAISQYLGARRA
jgi:hypothetical protein